MTKYYSVQADDAIIRITSGASITYARMTSFRAATSSNVLQQVNERIANISSGADLGELLVFLDGSSTVAASIKKDVDNQFSCRIGFHYAKGNYTVDASRWTQLHPV